MGRVIALAACIAALPLMACGSDEGDTTINKTTTVIGATGAGGAEGAEEPEGPTQEFSGRCPGSREATAEKTGFADVQVGEGSCDFAVSVATEFADSYRPDCFDGCTRQIEGLRCETQPPLHAELVCFAARTEVRFTVSGAD